MGILVKRAARFLILLACMGSSPEIAQAEWQAIEKVQTYSIAGRTGPELYDSIGARGPEVANKVRAIAHTNFKLTWTRKYEPQGDACVLVSARPKLIITYVLPKPAGRLPEPVRTGWETFINGVRDHEKVHGTFIKEMVGEIESASIGLSVADDADCQKIRLSLKERLSAISRAQQQRSRDFDRAELTEGGNIHQLILSLVNGNQAP
jgi:predicted secreted Zn-dependent protease